MICSLLLENNPSNDKTRNPQTQELIISTLCHVSVSLLHESYYTSKIFSSVQNWDLDIRDMIKLRLLRGNWILPRWWWVLFCSWCWVWWPGTAGAHAYDNQRFCIIKRVYSWALWSLRGAQKFTWEMLGSQWQWRYQNYRHLKQRISSPLSSSLCPPKTCTRM